MRSRLALALTLSLVATSGAAPVAAQSSPQSAAHEFFAALEGRRWNEAAAIVDPEQLGPYKEQTLSMLVAWARYRDERRRRPRRGSGALRPLGDGKLDPQALARFGDTPLANIPGVRTLRDLAALPPTEFVARLFEASDHRSNDRMRARVDSSRRRILGAVAESDSVGHVLYRSEGPGIRNDDPYHVEVLAAVRRGDRWYVRTRHGGQPFGSLSFLLIRLDELEPERK